MPISRPVVNGIFNLPAFAIVFSRTPGSLSGAPSWAMPGPIRRLLVVSSMMPMLGLYLSQALEILAAHDARIGVRQQRRVIENELAHLHQVIYGAPVTMLFQGVAHLREQRFRLVAQAEEGLFAAQTWRPLWATRNTSSGAMVLAPGSPGSLRKVQ